MGLLCRFETVNVQGETVLIIIHYCFPCTFTVFPSTFTKLHPLYYYLLFIIIIVVVLVITTTTTTTTMMVMMMINTESVMCWNNSSELK